MEEDLKCAPRALCVFTGGVVKANGSCRAGFLRKQSRGGERPRPLRLLTAFASTLPLLSLRDIFPRSGGSLSSKGEARARPEAFSLHLKL